MPSPCLLVLHPLIIARFAPPLPRTWSKVEGLTISDEGRRRLSDAALHESNHIHVSFHTNTTAFEADLARINIWAPDATLIINQDGMSTSPVTLPRLPTFRGHMVNASDSGQVSAVVLSTGALRMRIYEAGQDMVLESAVSFDTAGTSTLTAQDNIVYPIGAFQHAGVMDDDVFYLKSVSAAGASGGRRLREGSLNKLPAVATAEKPPVFGTRRQASTLNTLPTGPPYGRMSSCPTSGFYQSQIGLIADWGFVAVAGGTAAAALAEIASILEQTNLIYEDQVDRQSTSSSPSPLTSHLSTPTSHLSPLTPHPSQLTTRSSRLTAHPRHSPPPSPHSHSRPRHSSPP